jgi:hypothetical protein
MQGAQRPARLAGVALESIGRATCSTTICDRIVESEFRREINGKLTQPGPSGERRLLVDGLSYARRSTPGGSGFGCSALFDIGCSVTIVGL